MDASDAVIVLTTWPADGDPAAAVTALVEERLVACVSILPEMESVYRWKGGVEHARERQLVIKTTAPRIPELVARLGRLHPYEVPELLVLRVSEGGRAYLDWLSASTSPLDPA